MSKGTPIRPIRIPDKLLVEIQTEIDLQERDGRRERETLTAFVLRAIQERIAKRKRSRAPRKPKGSDADADLWDMRFTLTDPYERMV